jgi:serine/threonine protein phosphatase PrpC
VNEQRKMGLISAAEIAESESRHVLIRSSGPEMFVSPDTTPSRCRPATRSSSHRRLHDEMSEAAIAASSRRRKDIDEIARELVARAVEIDGGDNTTAQVIRVRSVEQVGMYRGRPYRLAGLMALRNQYQTDLSGPVES